MPCWATCCPRSRKRCPRKPPVSWPPTAKLISYSLGLLSTGGSGCSRRDHRASREGRRMNKEPLQAKREPGPEPGSPGARRISAALTGKTCGFAADRERARRAGKVGAEQVQERYGTEQFQRAGIVDPLRRASWLILNTEFSTVCLNGTHLPADY